jgi:hypothetical protein
MGNSAYVAANHNRYSLSAEDNILISLLDKIKILGGRNAIKHILDSFDNYL